MKRRESTGGAIPRPWIGISALMMGMAVVGCMDLTTPDPADDFPIEDVDFASSLGIDLDEFDEQASGLLLRVDQMGMPPHAGPGTIVEVTFQGWLPSGDLITETQPGEPFEFLLGGNSVLAGVQQGVDGMGVGEVRTVLVPPYLGYGADPPQGVPRNSWLVYQLELVAVDGQDGGPG